MSEDAAAPADAVLNCASIIRSKKAAGSLFLNLLQSMAAWLRQKAFDPVNGR
ncbi:hypothetical protein [Brucella tritici]|uniref:hypothetical protein n=1 Tax=Brucella tritici TaxID=94626 RepID=UPI00178C3FFC|nr:hypothetical protein [Brucella tritici]